MHTSCRSHATSTLNRSVCDPESAWKHLGAGHLAAACKRPFVQGRGARLLQVSALLLDAKDPLWSIGRALANMACWQCDWCAQQAIPLEHMPTKQHFSAGPLLYPPFPRASRTHHIPQKSQRFYLSKPHELPSPAENCIHSTLQLLESSGRAPKYQCVASAELPAVITTRLLLNSPLFLEAILGATMQAHRPRAGPTNTGPQANSVCIACEALSARNGATEWPPTLNHAVSIQQNKWSLSVQAKSKELHPSSTAVHTNRKSWTILKVLPCSTVSTICARIHLFLIVFVDSSYELLRANAHWKAPKLTLVGSKPMSNKASLTSAAKAAKRG